MKDLETEKWYEERKARNAKYKAAGLAQLNKDFPELIVDESKLQIVDFSDTHYQVNNKEYYTTSYMHHYATQWQTDLGRKLEDVEKYREEYQIIEGEYYIIVITGVPSCLVWVDTYYTDNGKKVRGKRCSREPKQSTKGNYIMLNGKRVYVTF